MSSHRRVLMTRRAQHDLDALDPTRRAVVLTAIAAFARGDLNADVRKLQGYDPGRWRLRVWQYRVIFGLEPGVMIVQRVLDWREAYR